MQDAVISGQLRPVSRGGGAKLMSAENEALLRRWFEEVWNKGRSEAIDEMFAPDGIAHGLGDTQVIGPEAFKGFHATFKGAFPDIKISVDDILSQGDRVAVRFTIRATHRGDHLGVPASGREVTVPAMSIVRCKNGQIAEGWNTVDMLGMMQQIDAIPANPSMLSGPTSGMTGADPSGTTR
jgi:steroid delta-isomerase-like uncharacterized protein